MPKGFNDKEKGIIRKALIDKGKALFSAYGIKKTSIEDITKAVGIAQGSFYSFYGSKEELYFDILEIEEDLIKAEFMNENIFTENKPKKAIKKILLRSFELIQNNPIIKQLYFENEMESLIRKLPDEKIQAHFNKDSELLLPIIQRWQAEGILCKKEPKLIAGVLRSLFVMTLHRKEIGEAVYSGTVEFLIDAIVEGLVNEEA